MEETAAALIARKQVLTESPALQNEDTARLWLQELPAPSGWFSTADEARAHVKRTHQAAPILPGKMVQDAREQLGLSRALFASRLGMGGNDNTRHKSFFFEIETEALNKSSGRPRVLNPNAVERLKALIAEHGLDLATK